MSTSTAAHATRTTPTVTIGWLGTALLLALLVALGLFVAQLHGDMAQHPGIISPLDRLPVLPIPLGAATFVLVTVLGVALHEAGHVVAGKITGRELERVSISPGLTVGASVKLSGAAPTGWSRVLISIAGPAFEFALGLLVVSALLPSLGWWLVATPLGLAGAVCLFGGIANLAIGSDGRRAARGVWQLTRNRS